MVMILQIFLCLIVLFQIVVNRTQTVQSLYTAKVDCVPKGILKPVLIILQIGKPILCNNLSGLLGSRFFKMVLEFKATSTLRVFVAALRIFLLIFGNESIVRIPH